MRYFLNGPINLWDRIGGKKPNRRLLSESEQNTANRFLAAGSDPIVDGTSSLFLQHGRKDIPT